MPLRTPGALSRMRSRPVLTALGGGSVAALLSVPAMSSRTIPRRCGTGRERHGVLAWGAPHAGDGGSAAPFDHGRRQMEVLAGLEVTAKAVERTAEAIGEHIAMGEQKEIQRAVQLDLPIIIGKPVPILYVQMDGTGVPVVKKETVGRKGKTDGQPAHTREVKLGCVFTQTTWDKEGYAIRDPDSTTYTGAIENAEEFGKRIYVEAWKRGWSRAQKKIVMGDGAEWIWNLADQHFPGARQIVDLYHARQHLWELARRLHPNDSAVQKTWMRPHQKRLLDKGKIEKLVASLRSIDSTNAEVARKDSHRGRLL